VWTTQCDFHEKVKCSSSIMHFIYFERLNDCKKDNGQLDTGMPEKL
jgi:hypothetical protein